VGDGSPAVLGGQIELMFDPLQSVLPHVQAGKLTGLAVGVGSADGGTS
jgi:tripartite-type tricarboxylate transporter receptor subunit TctC